MHSPRARGTRRVPCICVAGRAHIARVPPSPLRLRDGIAQPLRHTLHCEVGSTRYHLVATVSIHLERGASDCAVKEDLTRLRGCSWLQGLGGLLWDTLVFGTLTSPLPRTPHPGQENARRGMLCPLPGERTPRNACTLPHLKSFLALACRLDFYFSVVWLFSSANSIADTASRFYITRMFEVTPSLNQQPSSKPLRLGGTSSIPSRPKLSHFTFSMASQPQLDEPTVPNAIMGWVTSLGGKVESKTIKIYLTHVRSLLVDAHRPFAVCESLIFARLVRGIKKYHGGKNRRPVQPITLLVLTALLAPLKPGTIPGHSTTYASCCLVYRGLLRSGRFTANKSKGPIGPCSRTRTLF